MLRVPTNTEMISVWQLNEVCLPSCLAKCYFWASYLISELKTALKKKIIILLLTALPRKYKGKVGKKWDKRAGPAYNHHTGGEFGFVVYVEQKYGNKHTHLDTHNFRQKHRFIIKHTEWFHIDPHSDIQLPTHMGQLQTVLMLVSYGFEKPF